MSCNVDMMEDLMDDMVDLECDMAMASNNDNASF